MKIALCNEVLRELDFPAQCDYAASLGYDGLEIAPFTLGENPHLLATSKRHLVRQAAADSGIDIVGLHWLLVEPVGLSINTKDESVRRQTIEVMRRLVELCSDLGGSVLVHGSPAQRQIEPDDDPAKAWNRALDTFAAVKDDVEAAGITYCIEPLTQTETNFINTIAEAARFVAPLESEAFRSMLDHKAATAAEEQTPAELFEEWFPKGMIGHVHVNDSNRKGPGQGEDRFSATFAALMKYGYSDWVSVEPFEYTPDARGTAARAVGYIQGVLEGLHEKTGSKL